MRSDGQVPQLGREHEQREERSRDRKKEERQREREREKEREGEREREPDRARDKREGGLNQSILRTDILERTSEEERERGGEREKRERARIREEVGGPKAQPCPLTFAKLFPPPRACAQGPAQATDPPRDSPKPPLPPARAGPGGGTHGAALVGWEIRERGGEAQRPSPSS